MKVAVIGTGYVGLVAGTCFAETGNEVVCMDIDQARVADLEAGRVPLYEPGLGELVERNVRESRLRFTTSIEEAVRASQVVFIAVGTPTSEDGSSDLGQVLEAARSVARAMDGPRVIVTKSTVPVGTAERMRREVAGLTEHPFDVVSNPEFLKEGAAVEDFMKPDRVVVGAETGRAARLMRELYAPFTRTGAPILVMDCRSAEMTKYAANALLASRISFMNEVANLCEHLGADVHLVRQAVGLDRRIGPSFLFPGAGYGGSCFPKDIRRLIRMAEEHDCPAPVIRAVDELNELQKKVLPYKIFKYYREGASSGAQAALKGNRETLEALLAAARSEQVLGEKTFAVWGLAFKPRTDDMREAPSLELVDQLLGAGARVRVYDPEAMDNARALLAETVEYAENVYQPLEGADALVLVTEWNVFRNPDFERVRSLLKAPVIFDGRNQYDPKEMRALGFTYFGIGRP